jgi:hypothetical protein
MGGVCDGSDPTAPVEFGNSQHSPPTSLDHDIARLQPVLLISSKFLKRVVDVDALDVLR